MALQSRRSIRKNTPIAGSDVGIQDNLEVESGSFSGESAARAPIRHERVSRRGASVSAEGGKGQSRFGGRPHVPRECLRTTETDEPSREGTSSRRTSEIEAVRVVSMMNPRLRAFLMVVIGTAQVAVAPAVATRAEPNVVLITIDTVR